MIIEIFWNFNEFFEALIDHFYSGEDLLDVCLYQGMPSYPQLDIY